MGGGVYDLVVPAAPSYEYMQPGSEQFDIPPFTDGPEYALPDQVSFDVAGDDDDANDDDDGNWYDEVVDAPDDGAGDAGGNWFDDVVEPKSELGDEFVNDSDEEPDGFGDI